MSAKDETICAKDATMSAKDATMSAKDATRSAKNATMSAKAATRAAALKLTIACNKSPPAPELGERKRAIKLKQTLAFQFEP